MDVESAINVLQTIQSEELSSFFEEHDGDLRPWGTKEWKEQRDEFLQNECEWCGEAEEPLQIHHTSSSPDWGDIWINATDEAFVNSDAYNDELATERYECPECGLRDYYERTTMSPKYRCNNCKETFSEPRMIPGAQVIVDTTYDTKPYTTPEYICRKAEWVQENRDAVAGQFRNYFETQMQQYMEMNDVVTICRSCHYQEEQTSNKRCTKCGENWHSYTKNMCWECLKEEKGLEKCSICDDGWYQPSKYDACSDCR